MISKKTVATIAVILLFLGMVYAPQKYIIHKTFAKTLSPYNADEYGTLNFIEFFNNTGYNVVLGGPQNLSRLGDGDIYVLIGPDQSLSEEEIRQVKAFLKRGGSILIADELGTVNTLTETLFGTRINDTYVEKLFTYINSTRAKRLRVIASNEPVLFPTHIGVLALPDNVSVLEPLEPGMDVYNASMYLYSLYEEFSYLRAEGYMAYPTSLPSYIEELGIMMPAGYIVVVDKRDPDTGKTYSKLSVFSAYYNPDDDPLHRYAGRVYLVTDTLLFTNSYVVSSLEEAYMWGQVYRRMEFYSRLMHWLSKGTVDSYPPPTILFDSIHYQPYEVKVPLPHLGRLLVGMLAEEVKLWKDTYMDRIDTIPIWLMPLLVLFVVISVYTTYRRRVKVKSGDDRWIPPVEERRFVAESPFLKRLKEGIRDKEFYKDMIMGLYDLYNYILKEIIGRDIEEIVREGLPPAVEEKLGGEASSKILESCRRIYGLREKIVYRRMLPFILSWKKTFEKLSYEVDYVCSRLGIEFIEEIEGGKKIEYVIK